MLNDTSVCLLIWGLEACATSDAYRLQPALLPTPAPPPASAAADTCPASSQRCCGHLFTSLSSPPPKRRAGRAASLPPNQHTNQTQLVLFNTTSRLGSNPCLCLCLPASVTCPFALPCVSGGCLLPCLSCRRRLRCLPRASAAACACLPALSQRCRRRLPRLDPTLLPVTALPVPPHGLKRQARWARPDPCPASSQRCCGHLHRLQPVLLLTPAPPPASAAANPCTASSQRGTASSQRCCGHLPRLQPTLLRVPASSSATKGCRQCRAGQRSRQGRAGRRRADGRARVAVGAGRGAGQQVRAQWCALATGWQRARSGRACSRAAPRAAAACRPAQGSTHRPHPTASQPQANPSRPPAHKQQHVSMEGWC